MNKTILLFAAMACLAPGAAALVPGELTVSSDITFSSNYVFRGIQRADHSFQPNLELAHPVALSFAGMGDLYAGAWGNLPTGSGEGELHYYAGVSFDLPAVDLGPMEAGLTVYHLPGTGSNRTHELFLGSHFTCPGRPALWGSVFYFHDLDLRSHVGEGRITYSYSLERIGLPAAIDFSLVGGVQGGSRVKTESYHYYGGALELPLILSDHSLLTAGVHYATAGNLTFGPGERGRSLFWSIGYATFFD
jgi:hypothetical protein